ncbi:MAG TPA: hypothetical protein VE173_04650, partial [Longimicrobiales bacterium]|nr:hypothetical protein [Longimicrobiales bacterium]
MRMTCPDVRYRSSRSPHGVSRGALRQAVRPGSRLAQILALIFGGVVLLPQPLSAQWQPDHFQFFCGTPFALTTSEQWLNVLRQEGYLESRHAKDYRNYLENLGTELDDAAPGCLDPERLVEMGEMARDAFLGLKSVGSEAGRRFTDPSPVRLGPVVLDEAGQRVVRL